MQILEGLKLERRKLKCVGENCNLLQKFIRRKYKRCKYMGFSICELKNGIFIPKREKHIFCPSCSRKRVVELRKFKKFVKVKRAKQQKEPIKKMAKMCIECPKCFEAERKHFSLCKKMSSQKKSNLCV